MLQNDEVRDLSDRETSREKLHVFYGGKENFTHGFREVLNNGIDEVLNNFDNGKVEIELHEDFQTITVKDSGRGIPIQNQSSKNIPYYKLIFETLFASGKYDKNDKSYSGVNGVGLCVLNYTSQIFNVEICNEGYKYIIEYENGGNIKTPLTKLEKTNDHYTQITFKLDESIYPNTIYSYEYIKNITNKTAKVSPRVELLLRHKGNQETFHYDSLEDYFIKHSLKNHTTPYAETNKTYEEPDGEKTQIEIVFSSTNEEESLIQECMLNGNNLIERSTIHEGIITGFKNFSHKYCKDNNLYSKKEKGISIENVENSINFCCNILSNRVEFKGQTKFSTEKELYKEVSQKYVQEILEFYSIENKDEFIKLVKQILLCKRAYETSAKTMMAAKKRLSEKVDSMYGRVDGLIDCKYHNDNSEIFIAEGKSAMGSVILSRDPNTQAGYAIRGKIMSCLKASYSEIFSNAVIIDLIKILGCGVEVKSKHNKDLDNFNMNNLRYGKIVISTDEDFDGKNIQVLLLTMIYRLMPQLLTTGKVYIAQTPKYIIKNKKDKHYAFNDAEKDAIIKKLKGKVSINYLKGLGELDAIDMYNTALNPETRKMTRVSIGDIEQTIDKFEVWMGTDVTRRRDFIQSHLHEYISDIE